MKGKKIFIVRIEGTYDEGVQAFENYNDALTFALEKLNEFENEVDCDPEDLTKRITQQEIVSNGTPISHIPFQANIHADNSEEDYVAVEIVNDIIH